MAPEPIPAYIVENAMRALYVLCEHEGERTERLQRALGKLAILRHNTLCERFLNDDTRAALEAAEAAMDEGRIDDAAARIAVFIGGALEESGVAYGRAEARE